jgi:hypothetical protein
MITRLPCIELVAAELLVGLCLCGQTGGLNVIVYAARYRHGKVRALRSLGYSALPRSCGAAAQGFAEGRGWAAVRDSLSCQANPGQAEL